LSSPHSDNAKECNKARIAVLQRQSELIDSIVDESRDRLEAVTSDTGSYSELLVGLIVQGLLKLAEEDSLIR